VSFNGSGLFQINSTGQPVVVSTSIDPTVFNALTADLAAGLSTCITKDGQTTVTANIPMSNFKFTGLAAGSSRTDSASLANVQDGTGIYVATVGGTADVITLSPSPAITSYTAGQTFRFIASGANTTNVTVNVSALGAKAITKNGTTALVAGDIPSGMMVEITYDGTRFILGTIGAASALSTASGGSVGGDVTIAVSDARTNTVDVPLTVTSTTSGTPAAGIGTGILLRAESGDENPSDFGQIEVAASDVGAGTEDTYFQFLTRVAGAALAATYRWVATAANKAIFTHANTGDRTYTLPDATGNIPTVASQSEVNAMTSTTTALSPNHNLLVTGTVIATTSGTAHTFTGIPSGVRRITIELSGVSLSGTDDLLVQIGDSGGLETSSYESTGAGLNSTGTSIVTSTTGYVIYVNVATALVSGHMTLTLIDPATNTWVSSHAAKVGTTFVMTGGGNKSLSGELTQVSLTRTGANTFDAGQVNVKWER
jgi:hypothetical protein